MNQTIETILNHVSVRSFTDVPLSNEQIMELVTAAQAASTASYQQNYSIIGVSDPELKKKLAKEAGNLPFITDGGHFFVFCADLKRNKEIAEEIEMDITETLEGIDAALIGAIDATIAAQNMVIAAESMGLGVCYIGGVRDGIENISELLNIPKYVFPVFGLVVGYPKGERNDLKPRLPFEAVYHENTYDSNKLKIVKDYDQVTEDYYKKRSGGAVGRRWSKTAIESLKNLPRTHMRDYLSSKGFAKR